MRRAIRRMAESSVRQAFRVTEFSVQSNHVHLVVEARDGTILSRGMQGLAVRLARAINGLLATRGKVWRERFHARELRTPTEVRNALVYVLMNARKHGARLRDGVDPFSSAPWFDGFSSRPQREIGECPVSAARTWLGGTGWRRRGLLRPDERPRAPS